MAARRQEAPAIPGLRRRIGLLAVVSVLVVASAVALYLSDYRARLLSDETEILDLAAAVAAGEITEWWQLREADASTLRFTTGFSDRVRNLIEDPSVASDRARVRDRIESEIEYHGFDEVLVLAPDGTHVETVGSSTFVVHEETADAVERVNLTGELVPVGPYAVSGGVVLVEWVVPLELETAGIVAAVVMRSEISEPWTHDLEAARALGGVDELTVYGSVGGTSRALLNTRESLPDPSLGVVLPDADTTPSPSGVVETVDRRGNAVLAAVREVEGTSLRVVATSERAAVLAPLSTQYSVATAGALLVLLVLGLLARLQYTAMRIAAAEGRREELEGLVAERTSELERTVERLAEADAHKDRFLARMSHDFRTPLNAIIGFADLLAEQVPGPLNEEQARQVDMVADAGRQLLDLVNDVLDISTISAGGTSLVIEPVNVQDVVTSVAPLLDLEASAKDVEVRTVLTADPLWIRTDEARLRQILMNIGGNAVKFTDAGCVELRVHRDDRWAVIEVRDTGCGIGEEDVALVTTEFFRSDEVRPKPGSGLGLAISERLVRLLGGSLSIESELGVGTQVAIRLPLGVESSQEHPQRD